MIITFSSCDFSSGPLLQELGWDNLSVGRIMLYALLLFIYSFMLLAVEMFKVYNNMAPYLIPMPKFLKMRPSYDTRGSSSRFQMPLPKTNWQKRFGYRDAFILDELPRICVIANQWTYLNLNWTDCFPASLIPYYNPSLELFYLRLIPSFTNIFFFFSKLIKNRNRNRNRS